MKPVEVLFWIMMSPVLVLSLMLALFGVIVLANCIMGGVEELLEEFDNLRCTIKNRKRR